MLEDSTDGIYDGIIVGAGHNGLITQAYLAKAGLKVLSIDQRSVPGGGLATEEDSDFPGFRHNTHAVFCRAVSAMPWFSDLDLEHFGAEMIEPPMNVALMTKDGDALQWWTDFDRTVESVARFSEKDADTLRRWYEEFVPIVNRYLRPELFHPPLPRDQRTKLLQQSAQGRRLLEVSELSPLEFVSREFEHPVVQAGLLFFNGLREVDMRVRGFGHHIVSLLASPAKAQLVRGGTAELGKALAASVVASGGEILLNTGVRRIVTEHGRAIGVETSNGQRFHARRFVATSLGPQQTFLEMLDSSMVPREIRRRAREYKYNLVAPLLTLHLRLSAAPTYRAAAHNPSVDDCYMSIMGIDDLETYQALVEAHEDGVLPPGPVLYGACMTKHDPTQAPKEKHAAFMWQKVPYNLYGNPDNWDRYADEVGEQMLAQWTRYAPNLEHAVEGWFTRNPRDTARSLPNLGEGDTIGGAFTQGQYLDGRPFAGAGQYRTPIDGLYLCGSCTHPGGNITGLPGYNAAQVLLADLGISVDWAPAPLAELWGA